MKTNKIFLILLILISLIDSTFANNLFSVQDITIEQDGASSSEAKKQGINEAKKIAYNTVLKKILTSRDYDSVSNESIELKTLDSFISSMEINKEQSSATKYKASINFNFSVSNLGSYLSNKGIKFITDSPSNTLLIPYVIDAQSGGLSNQSPSIAQSINTYIRNDKTNIIPIQTITNNSTGAMNLAFEENSEKLMNLTNSYAANNVITAKIYEITDSSARIEVNKIDTGTSEDYTIRFDNNTDPYSNIAAAVSEITNSIYKKDIINNKDNRAELIAVFTIRSINDVISIENMLKNLNFIKSYNVKALSPQMMQVSLKIQSNRNSIISSLQQKGYRVQDNGQYVIVKI